MELYGITSDEGELVATYTDRELATREARRWDLTPVKIAVEETPIDEPWQTPYTPIGECYVVGCTQPIKGHYTGPEGHGRFCRTHWDMDRTTPLIAGAMLRRESY